MPAGELDKAVDEWAARLAAGPPLAYSMIKAQLHVGAESSLAQALEYEATCQTVNFNSADTVEAMAAFVQKRDPNQGRRVRFTTCSLLVQELLAAKRDLKLSRVLKRLASFEVLLIDDLGYVQQSREEMEVLFTLLAERYERGSVLLTSNLPFSKWEAIFKDPMTTAAAIDRWCITA